MNWRVGDVTNWSVGASEHRRGLDVPGSPAASGSSERSDSPIRLISSSPDHCTSPPTHFTNPPTHCTNSPTHFTNSPTHQLTNCDGHSFRTADRAAIPACQAEAGVHFRDFADLDPRRHVGVMALVIALALMTGLQGELRDRILGSNPHIFVWKRGGIGDYLTQLEVAAARAARHRRGTGDHRQGAGVGGGRPGVHQPEGNRSGDGAAGDGDRRGHAERARSMP